MFIIRLLASIFLFLMSSCRVGPLYDPPDTLAPDAWKNSQDITAENTYADYWWEVFNDEILNCLETKAIENNPTLYVALQNLFRARALAGVAAADLYPQLNLNPSYTSTGILQQIFLPKNLPIPGLSGSIPPFRVHLLQYLLPLNLNYEVDLWGKLRDQYDSALFNAEAQGEAYCSSLLSLTADLANTYFQLRALDAKIDLLNATIQTRTKNLELTQSRFNKGLVTFLDVTQAEVDLANARVSYFDAIRMRNLAENQIAVQTGQLATEFHLAHNPLKGDPPEIPAGIPSTVLLQRPDIAQAERNMASQHALIKAAYATFFPSFSLTGALGYSSPDFSRFLRWISRYWTVGVSGSQMIFDGGRDTYNYQAAWAGFLEASGEYQQQVLTAFQEVEDSLSNIEQLNKEGEQLAIAVKSAKRATEISLNRYRRGVAIYLEVVENERLQLEAEINWVNVEGMLYVSTVQLIKALGGSWQTSLEDPLVEDHQSCFQ